MRTTWSTCAREWYRDRAEASRPAVRNRVLRWFPDCRLRFPFPSTQRSKPALPMNKDDRSPPAADSSAPSLGNLPTPGLSLFSTGPSFPGPLAPPEAVEAYHRGREEQELVRRMREEEGTRDPPPAPNIKALSLLDMISDSFNAGRQEGRREARLARELMAEDEASRADEKPSDKPHGPIQAERDRDEILAEANKGLSLHAAKKTVRKRLKGDGENPKIWGEP
jgi:hypothetical protein